MTSGGSSLKTPSSHTLFFSQRRGIPLEVVRKSLSYRSIGRMIRHAGPLMPVLGLHHFAPELFWATAVGIWLIHRDVWLECGGYNETYIYRDHMEIEMIMRLKSRYPIFNLGQATKHAFWHLDHDRVSPGKSAKNVEPDGLDNPEHVRVFSPNASDWGLANIDFPEVRIRPAQIDRGSAAFSHNVVSIFQILAGLLTLGFFNVTQLHYLKTPDAPLRAWRTALALRYRPENLLRHWRNWRRK